MLVIRFGETEWFAIGMDGRTVFHHESFAVFIEWLTAYVADNDLEFIVSDENDAYDRFEKCHELLLGLIAA